MTRTGVGVGFIRWTILHDPGLLGSGRCPRYGRRHAAPLALSSETGWNFWVSVVSAVAEMLQKHYAVRTAYFYVDVTTARLNKIAELFETGKLVPDLGTVFPLESARVAHEMRENAPHKRDQIVLNIAA